MSSIAQAMDTGPRIDRDEPKKRMAKAGIEDVTNSEKRAEYGRLLRRASEIAGLNRDQTADELRVDPAQISRWWSGAENPQAWRYHANYRMRGALLIAQAEAHEGASVETVVTIRRTA